MLPLSAFILVRNKYEVSVFFRAGQSGARLMKNERSLVASNKCIFGKFLHNLHSCRRAFNFPYVRIWLHYVFKDESKSKLQKFFLLKIYTLLAADTKVVWCVGTKGEETATGGFVFIL